MYFQKSADLNLSKAPKIEQRDHGQVCVIHGILSKPEIDSDYDLIEAGAWDGVPKSGVPMLWQHNARDPIGTWTDIQAKSDGLYGTGEILMGFELGKQAAHLAVSGALSGISVGFKVPNRKDNIAEKEMEIGGKRRKVRTIKKAELFEASLVTFPALGTARIRSKSSMFAALRGAGFSKEETEEIIAKYATEDDPDATLPETLMRFKSDDGKWISNRRIENLLIDAGLSEEEAVAFVAKGMPGVLELSDPDRAKRLADGEAAAKAAADEAARKAAEQNDAILKALQSLGDSFKK